MKIATFILIMITGLTASLFGQTFNRGVIPDDSIRIGIESDAVATDGQNYYAYYATRGGRVAIIVSKFDSTGKLIDSWRLNEVNGYPYYYFLGTHIIKYGPDSMLYVGGGAKIAINDTIREDGSFLVKINPKTMDSLWMKIYPAISNNSLSVLADFELRDDSIYAISHPVNSSGIGLISVLDTAGTIARQVTTGTGYTVYLNDIKLTNNTMWISGVRQYGFGANPGSSRIVQQYDWQGQMLKEYQTVDTSSSGKAEGLAVLPSGKFSFIMNSQDFLHYDYIPVPVRSAYPTFVSLDQQGDTLISIPIDSLRHSQQVRNAASDTKGNIVFAGMYSVIDSVLPTKNYGYMGKVSAQGKLLWSRPYTFSYTDHPDTVTYVRPLEAIIATDDGGAAAVGSFGAILSGVGKSHGWIIRVDSFGCVIPGCHLAPNSIAPALSKARLLIAPNPASDITYAHWLTEEPGEAVFSLRDAHGRLIRQWTNIQPEMTFVIPLQELASGMYYLDVLHHGRMLEGKKLVKQ